MPPRVDIRRYIIYAWIKWIKKGNPGSRGQRFRILIFDDCVKSVASQSFRVPGLIENLPLIENILKSFKPMYAFFKSGGPQIRHGEKACDGHDLSILDLKDFPHIWRGAV